MDLTNDSYVILIGTRRFTERYFRDRRGWLKVSARGRTFRMTAEQVLNHVLPAVAGLKPNVVIRVEHHEGRRAPREPRAAGSAEGRAAKPVSSTPASRKAGRAWRRPGGS